MERSKLDKLIKIARGEEKADLVIKNAKIVDVYSKNIISGDIAISDEYIAGIGDYDGINIIDANGKYATPGFIDAHIHIESSYVSPEEMGRMIIPHGGTTIIADPHEIVNVSGLVGLDYMIQAAKNTPLGIKYMVPSCVPCTPFENSGAIVDAQKIEEVITDESILGIGEFMDFPGIINRNPDVLDKILVGKKYNRIIDGHSPGLFEKDLNAYVAAGIRNDHECSTIEEMNDRISRGMYVMLREGSACHNLRTLIKGVNENNSRRCILCSDDRQPKTMIELGHLDNHLRICVEEGIDPITAIQMATLNASECYELRDRGGIAPNLRADICLIEDLKDFKVTNVIIAGEEVARDGKYLKEVKHHEIDSVRGSMHVLDFNKEKLKTHLKNNKVNIIGVVPGGVVTEKIVDEIELDKDGEFIFNPEKDIAKIAVIERHKNTGNVGVGFIKGYGIKKGAIALSVAHDSHNIIVVGTNDSDMEFAVNELIKQEGGIILVDNLKVIEQMPMEIAGLMSSKTGVWVDKKLTSIHNVAYKELGIHEYVEPVMTLCFMSLIVIPEIKITDTGIFDVTKFNFIDLEVK